jgi:hypothetical protein
MRIHDSTLPGFRRSKANSRGELCSYYRLDVPVGPAPSVNGNGNGRPFSGPVEVADEDTRHKVYTALCEVLGLSAAHHAALVARGLSDADIKAGRYATLPMSKRGEIALAVLALLKPDGVKVSDLLRVPGFVRNDAFPLYLAGRSGLLIPIMARDGTIGGMVLRPDKPALDPGGKPLSKYTWFTSSTHGGPGAVVTAHVPPVDAVSGAGFVMVAAVERVRVTEGPIKAHLAQFKTGMPTVGLPGVGSWRLALPALKAFGAHTARLAFDSDAAINPNVAAALARAVRGLVADGYELEVERWDAAHKGIDDALVAGATIRVSTGLDAVRSSLDIARRHGQSPCVEPDQVRPWVAWYLDRDPKAMFNDHELIEAMLRLRISDPIGFAGVETELKKHNLKAVFDGWVKQKQQQKKQAASAVPPDTPYVERGGCTFAILDMDGRPAEKKIASFTARIVGEIIRHEADESRRHFEIKATSTDGTVATATIKAEDFELMGWVPGSLGSKFKIEPGRGTRDLMRHCLQTLSHREKTVNYRDVHTALGWHEIGGAMVYLHRAGGIGESGPVDANVDPAENSLSCYRLPAPDEDKLRQAVEQVLLIPARLGDESAASIVMSLPYRAVLGPARSVPHFSGTTGTFKTSTAALAARFFAPGLEHGDPMPATWSSTANGLQRLQHEAGDMVLVVDNLVADGDQASRDLFKVDLVINSQGDLAGRRRMKPDGTLAPVLDPRATLVSTGECDPRRRSALGRSLIVEFRPGMVSLDGLKQCHRAARDGHYAQTIACYVKYLAAPGRLDAQRQSLRRFALKYQEQAIKSYPDFHPRQGEGVAELVAAWQLFLEFAVNTGVLAWDRAKGHVSDLRRHLFGLLAAQASIQAESDPAEVFVELVRSLLASKRAVLHATDGTMPPEDIAGACGWEQVTIVARNGPDTVWQPAPGAARIGWLDANHAYLDPSAAHAAAGRLARETHQALGTERQILARLAESNRIMVDPQQPGDRRRFARRTVIEGSRKRVVQMLRDEIIVPDNTTQSTTAQPNVGSPY